MKPFLPTKKQKEMIRKVAPNLANALFDEDNKEDMLFFEELEIRNSIRVATNQETYLGLKRIAKAISEGIKDDLPILIKELKKYVN